MKHHHKFGTMTYGLHTCSLVTTRRLCEPNEPRGSFTQVALSDWIQAFNAHPRIGEHRPSNQNISEKFAALSSSEQETAARTQTEHVALELASLNKQYEEKFGHRFLIFAAGRSSTEILEELKLRYEYSTYIPHYWGGV